MDLNPPTTPRDDAGRGRPNADCDAARLARAASLIELTRPEAALVELAPLVRHWARALWRAIALGGTVGPDVPPAGRPVEGSGVTQLSPAAREATRVGTGVRPPVHRAALRALAQEAP